MDYTNKNRWYLIEGKRYEWQWHGSICGLYEIPEPPRDEDDYPVENSRLDLICAPMHGKMYLESEKR